VACTGLHGANRLASNSLLEAVVVAHRASLVAREALEKVGRWGAGARVGEVAGTSGEPDPGRADAGASAGSTDPTAALRGLMWTHAGIVRHTRRLREAREALEARVSASAAGGPPRSPAEVEARNLEQVALLIVRSALRRRESRGLHYTTDHPWRDNERGLADTVLVRDVEGHDLRGDA
jgi:L-aspartate oxidase